jgi:putative ABC transport system permease protein
MIDLQLSKMDAAHQASQPSHISMILSSDVDMAVLTDLKALPGIAGVDALSQLSVYFRTSPASEWTLATLITRPDYLNQGFDKTLLDSGAWPSPAHLAIENLTAQFTGLRIGDSIEFKTAADNLIQPITGIVRHPFVKPPKFGGQAVFFAAAADGLPFGLLPHSFRQLLVQITPPYSEEQAQTVARNIRVLLAKQHVVAGVTLLQDPQRHWGRPFLSGVNGVLKLMALTALVLAGVLILKTVSAQLAQQRQQIGIMKALGGSTFTIVKIYLSETLLMALLATLLAIPLGLAAAYVSSCKILDLFNIDCGAFDFSPRAVLYMSAGGLFLPVVAALMPILRSASMTVRVAIADYGLGADFGDSRFDVCVERLAGNFLATLYAAAFANLFRSKTRFVLTQSVLIIAGTTFLVLMSLIASLNLTLDREMARSQYALRLSFSPDQDEQQVLEITKSVPVTENVEIWQRQQIEMLKDGKTLRQKGNLGAQLMALPSAAAMYQPLIEAGRWLQAADAGKRNLVVSADTAKLNGLEVGSALDITIGKETQGWQVVGIYRWLVAGNYVVEPVYVPLETLRAITPGKHKASFALVKAAIANREEEVEVLNLFKQRFQDNNIKLDVYNTQAKLKQQQFARNQFNPVVSTLFGLASMIAVVGGIGLSGTLAISVMQRTREIGVLLAIGASATAIYRLFFLEGLLHGLVAWVLSIALAYPAAEPLARELGKTMLGIDLDFAFDWTAVFYWLGIVLLLTWLASYSPASKAAKLTIRECLQH